MAGHQSDISLAELIKCMALLKPGSLEEQQRLLSCLGMGLLPEGVDFNAQKKGAWAGKQQHQNEDTVSTGKPDKGAIKPPPIILPEPTENLPFTLAALPDVDAPTPSQQLLSEIQNHEPLDLTQGYQGQTQREGIFPNKTARNIVSALLSLPRIGDELDLDRLVSQLCMQQPVLDLPKLARLSLCHGCQVLLDFNDAIVPFWPDLEQLQDQVAQVLGLENSRFYQFAQDPLDAVLCSEAAGQPWQPQQGKLVLVVTDFSLSSPHLDGGFFRAKSWQQFLRLCKKKQAPVLVLTTLSRDECPAIMAKSCPIVQWAPETRLSAILNLKRTHTDGGQN